MFNLFSVEEEEVKAPLSDQQPVETISAANIRAQLPAFNKKDIEVFFLQLEIVFSLYGVRNSLKKFQHTVSQLDGEAMREVIDLVREPPAEDPYECLKARLESSYGEPDGRRIQRLLGEQQLGDRRPSRFLRELQQLGGTLVTADVIKSIWLRGLPHRMQVALAASEHQDLKKLSEVADRIAEVTETRYEEVAAVKLARPPHHEERLLSTLEKLTERVAALESREIGSGPDMKSKSKSQGKGLCFYHSRFGNKAKKCVAPCNWNSGSKPSEN